jgi:FkbM family methyltransferase
MLKASKSRLLELAAWAARILPPGVIRLIYRSGPLARFLRKRLNQAAPQGLSEVQVAAGALQGCRLLLDMQTEKDYWLGVYEPELQDAISRWITPGSVVYDVGANIGYISISLARRVGAMGHVVAFEALPENQERLRRNLELNGLEERITLIPAAVVDQSRPVRFLVAESGGMGKAEGSAGRHETPYAHTIEVSGLSLDEFVFQQGYPPPQVVKMDIEGGEVLALPAMQRVLAEHHPLMLLELHGPEAERVAWDTLTAHGYTLRRLEPGYPVVSRIEDLKWKAYLLAEFLVS